MFRMLRKLEARILPYVAAAKARSDRIDAMHISRLLGLIVWVEFAVLLLLGLGRDEGTSRWWMLIVWPVAYFGGVGLPWFLEFTASGMENDPTYPRLHMDLCIVAARVSYIIWPTTIGIGLLAVFVLRATGVDYTDS